jgi:heme/copper-type cytochrome/quinol oxidase subunit 3
MIIRVCLDVGSSQTPFHPPQINEKYDTQMHHFGFEAVASYQHFVDVVWLFLFVSIYWWGGN